MISAIAEWAERNSWRCELSAKSFAIAEHPVLRAYRITDEAYIGFLSAFSRLESGDGCEWFLFPDDFAENADPSAFAWNEFERISAEAALDERGAAEVREWWSRHLPIMMSVRGGYSFYALDTDSNHIVKGIEPEFEETWEAAESFSEFMEKFISGTLE